MLTYGPTRQTLRQTADHMGLSWCELDTVPRSYAWGTCLEHGMPNALLNRFLPSNCDLA